MHLHLSVQPGGISSWNGIWTTNSKIIQFDEVGAEVQQGALYTSQNDPTCDVPDVPSACFSQTLGRNVTENECVQVSYEGNPCGSACSLNRCDSLVLLDHILDGPRGGSDVVMLRRQRGQVPRRWSSTCCS